MNAWYPWTSPNAVCPARPSVQPPFCCILFVGLCLQFLKSCSVGFRSGGHWTISHFSASRNSWVPFADCFGSFSICTLKCWPIIFAGFAWIWAALNTSQFKLLLLSAVTSSVSTSGPVPLAAIHAHAITLPLECLTVCGMLWIMSCSFSSIPIVLVQVWFLSRGCFSEPGRPLDV